MDSVDRMGGLFCDMWDRDPTEKSCVYQPTAFKWRCHLFWRSNWIATMCNSSLSKYVYVERNVCILFTASNQRFPIVYEVCLQYYAHSRNTSKRKIYTLMIYQKDNKVNRILNYESKYLCLTTQLNPLILHTEWLDRTYAFQTHLTEDDEWLKCYWNVLWRYIVTWFQVLSLLKMCAQMRFSIQQIVFICDKKENHWIEYEITDIENKRCGRLGTNEYLLICTFFWFVVCM